MSSEGHRRSTSDRAEPRDRAKAQYPFRSPSGVDSEDGGYTSEPEAGCSRDGSRDDVDEEHGGHGGTDSDNAAPSFLDASLLREPTKQLRNHNHTEADLFIYMNYVAHPVAISSS